TFKTLCLLNYVLMIRHDYDMTSSLRRGALQPQSRPIMRVEALVVNGLRRRGRPKLMWDERLKHDMKGLLLSEDMIFDINLPRVPFALVFTLGRDLLCFCFFYLGCPLGEDVTESAYENKPQVHLSQASPIHI
nr:putative cytochrome P450 [Tanacetum cinerariifolium]